MTDIVKTEEDTWYLYLVRTVDNKLYCGISLNPVVRFYQHCTGRGAKFFNTSRAMALVYIERCETKSHALKRERAVKLLTKVLKEQLIIAAPQQYKLPLLYNNERLTFVDIKL